MNLVNILSLSLFFVFFISFTLKLLILYRRNGINANVLAKGGKSKEIDNTERFVRITTFVWGMLWFILSIPYSRVRYLTSFGLENNFIRYIGITALTIGISIFIIAMISMKTSWRAGIDKKTESLLVTDGIYVYSRNPAFVGFDIMFIGFFLTFPGILTLIVAALNILAIHKLILQEEKHLKSAFGDKYTEYKSKTPRYILVDRGVKMKSYSEKVKFQYKILAKIYDLMDIIGFPIKKCNPRLGLAGHISNDDISVLDVCCGTGNSGISIAAKNDRNNVVGIDISEQMLKVAQNKIKRKKLNNITLLCMDATCINLNEFDAVTTSLSLHEMPKDVMNSVILEMGRALKNNGKMYIIEWDKPQNTLSSAVFMLFPYLFEPKGFEDFLKLNWEDYLYKYGLKVEGIEKYRFTKLIIASKDLFG